MYSKTKTFDPKTSYFWRAQSWMKSTLFYCWGAVQVGSYRTGPPEWRMLGYPPTWPVHPHSCHASSCIPLKKRISRSWNQYPVVFYLSLLNLYFSRRCQSQLRKYISKLHNLKWLLLKKKPACLLKLQGRFNEAKAFLKQSVQQWHVDYVIC